ncbi:FAD-binding oxidoreductase [Puniceibacterium sp. IMCC21224]|uniref:NAD(P)/FAD-dependent oxidoreductase n=1 Tax=Puniceibacterium sp. IMCC21224 TaxID=1618204 RepID=UPI00065D1330|nr:FAD-binding oxidoreductase [Puniceibacterium sp. IMCC21224]KMK67764.1 glycine/D-amino acid oxidase, deaminating [Puniceibacterium sp. IMCC21224]
MSTLPRDAEHVVVIGAGIVGVSTAIWLRRFGAFVTLIDRTAPGQGTSYGNGGVLAACAMVPVTGPGLLRKAPGMLLDRDQPLFLKWGYLPRLMPWLLKYLSHANDADTRRIALGLTPIVGDSAAQHMSLTDGLAARRYVVPGEYVYAYGDRADFDAEAYSWGLRAEAGFEPQLIEGGAVREYEPNFGPDVGCLAVLSDHGHVRDPGGYVAALAADFVAMGGRIRTTDVHDVQLDGDRISAVLTADGPIACDRAVIAGGIWSGPLMQKLGINVPLETERGYHIVFEGADHGPSVSVMVNAGKFVATPMDAGLRCAGIIEFGGLDVPPSRTPFALLRRKMRQTFPGLTHGREVEWMGHRPATADSLPCIGEVRSTGIYTAFGHHHIGLTAGPKTGRLLAGLMTGEPSNTDLTPYQPGRFS